MIRKIKRKLIKNVEARVLPVTVVSLVIVAAMITAFTILPFVKVETASALQMGNFLLQNSTAYITYNNYDFMNGIWVQPSVNGDVNNITVYFESVTDTAIYQCALYEYIDYTYPGGLFAGNCTNTTDIKQVTAAQANTNQTFVFNESQRPHVIGGTKYYIFIRPIAYYTSANKIGTVEEGPNRIHGVCLGRSHVAAYDFISPLVDDYNTSAYFSMYATYNASGENVSTFTVSGLTNNIVTWSGAAGSTVWSNSSGEHNENLEINMTINLTDNVTELRVWVGNLNNTGSTVYINSSNITMYVSSDNSSYGLLGTFVDGGSNLSINSTNWNAGTMGTNPFLGIGITNKSASIWCAFKLTIPADTAANTYCSLSLTSWKIYIGHNI